MAIVKLTDETWLEQEASKVEGVLRSSLALGGKDGQEGKDTGLLVSILSYAGLDYTGPQLAAIRDKLIADGVIEIV